MNNYVVVFLGSLVYVTQQTSSAACVPSVTTVSGYAAPKGPICSGQLIFEDNFNSLNSSQWGHEVSMSGGGNNEFQLYSKSKNNSFTQNGKLFLKPTILAFEKGEDFLTHGTIDLGRDCTSDNPDDCRRTGTPERILPPVISGRLHTDGLFSFKYGYTEISAKTSTGDWLWPALWLLPQYSVYGDLPRSGEIDLVETRGNEHLNYHGIDMGSTYCECTLHFGPDDEHDGQEHANFVQVNKNGFNNGYHKFAFDWKPDSMRILYDDVQIGFINTSFWELGGFKGDNIWKNGGKMAPFDQEFYLILNLAIGGNYFPDNAGNKPWKNGSPNAMNDFWNARNQWLPTWNLDTNNAALIIDYVRVYAS